MSVAVTLLRLLVAVALLYGIGRWIASPTELLDAAMSAQPRWLLLAAALSPVGLLLQWWKWRRLLRDSMPQVGEGDILRSLFAGFGLGLLTPGRLGELGRGAGLSKDRRRATALAGADRLLSGGITLLIGLLCASYTAPSLALWCVGVIGASGTLLWYARGWGRPERLILWYQRSALADVTGPAWAGNVIAALLFNLLFFAQMFCLLRAAGPLSVDAVVAIPTMFALKTMLPISLMDLGVREGAAVAVLGVAGVTATIAIQASLMLFALNVLAPGLAGLGFLFFGMRSMSRPTNSKRVEFAHVC